MHVVISLSSNCNRELLLLYHVSCSSSGIVVNRDHTFYTYFLSCISHHGLFNHPRWFVCFSFSIKIYNYLYPWIKRFAFLFCLEKIVMAPKINWTFYYRLYIILMSHWWLVYSLSYRLAVIQITAGYRKFIIVLFFLAALLNWCNK